MAVKKNCNVTEDTPRGILMKAPTAVRAERSAVRANNFVF